MRKLLITGNLVADAELKMGTNGTQFVTFRIGNNEYFDKTDSKQQKPFWVNVLLFNNLSLINHLKKGKHVQIIGNYKQSVYASKATGQCEVSNDITADSVEFVSVGRSENTTTTTTPPTTQTSVTNAVADKPEKAVMTTAEVANTVPKQINAQSLDDDDDLPF